MKNVLAAGRNIFFSEAEENAAAFYEYTRLCLQNVHGYGM